MSFENIKRSLREAGELFYDKEFPANSTILCDQHKHDRIQWKRPLMIATKGNPKFVVNGATRFDFDQGAIGDCWFVSAAAILATSHKNCFSKVVPQDQGFDHDYTGIFRFYFWSYGVWKEVIIDDYLPCTENGLLYCRNREEPNEFWAALLEKAYAKYYGSYENLKGGYIHYALIDLTGGVTQTLPIKNYTSSPSDLFNILCRTHQMSAFIGAAIFKTNNSQSGEIGLKNGLFQGHAYSITGFQTVIFNSQTEYLIRVRNPWGAGEWKGRWSDRWITYTPLSEDTRRLLKPKIQRDGEFWISIQDFVQNFNQIQMCHPTADSMVSEVMVDMKKDDWKMSGFHGAWRRVETSSGCFSRRQSKFHHPQYYLKVDQTDSDGRCDVVVSLMEKEKRKSSDPPVFINFLVYMLPGERFHHLSPRDRKRSELVGKGSEKYVYYKEVARRFALPIGFYVLVPKTHRRESEAEFFFRIYAKNNVQVGTMTFPEDR